MTNNLMLMRFKVRSEYIGARVLSKHILGEGDQL